MYRILSRIHSARGFSATRPTTSRSSFSDAAPSKAVEMSVNKNDKSSRFAIKPLTSEEPIEKLSLSRGLAMNKFEKDFMIYPEYTDTDDVRNLEGFLNILRNSLELTLDPRELEKEGSLSPEITETLHSNAAFALTIAKDFGGCGMVRKDAMKVFEELSVDWNVYTCAWVSHAVANLLVIYGSEEQKQKYLPLIANGKCRPAIAIVKDSSSGSCKTTQGSSGMLLTAEGVKVIGAHNANLFVIFGKGISRVSKVAESTCCLIGVTELRAGDQHKFTRDSTLGLKAVDIGRLDLSVQLADANVLGGPGAGAEVSAELAGLGRMPLAAGTVGLAKRALREMATICNRSPSRTTANSTLADDSRSQRIVTSLAQKVYALESVLYYLAGMMDEGLTIVVDVENALISMLSREVLESLVSMLLELGGVATTDTAFPFEKTIRDISTLLSVLDDGTDVEKIAVATLATWASSTGHQRITSTLKRLFTKERDDETMKNPRLSHYIAEHAHPSLQLACQELEFSMARINTVISKMVTTQGKNLEQDYGSLEALVNVLKNNLVMVATIARSSRSYSIGLRNADIELAWATMICSRLSRATWFELEALSDLFGLVRFNPSLLSAGRAVFDLGGYAIESPLERNW